MKNFNFILPAIIVLVFIVAVLLLPFFFLGSVDVKEVGNMTLEVGENLMFREEKTYYPLKGMVVEMNNDTIPLGIAGQSYELNFGRIPWNSSVRKMLNFGTENFVRTDFHVSGNISKFVIMPGNFYLEKDVGEVTVTFNGTEIGNFTGTLLVRNIIPKNFLCEKILRVI